MPVDIAIIPPQAEEGEEMNYRRGDIVLIRKGTPLRSTNPSKRVFMAAKTYRVKLHNVYKWPRVELVWPGSGGYWTYANAEELK